MFIVLAQNITEGGLTKPDGTSDYRVQIRLNERLIVDIPVKGHIRANGGAELLRKIADEWDNHKGDLGDGQKQDAS